METFKHNFKTSFGVIDIMGINGYTQALRAIYEHIEKATEFKPEKRYIDAVPILDKINSTTLELQELLKEAETDLSEVLNIGT